MGHKFHRRVYCGKKTAFMDRWKRGESLKAIGTSFWLSSHRRSIFWWLRMVDSSLRSGVAPGCIDARGTRGDAEALRHIIGTIDRPKLLGRSPRR